MRFREFILACLYAVGRAKFCVFALHLRRSWLSFRDTRFRIARSESFLAEMFREHSGIGAMRSRADETEHLRNQGLVPPSCAIV